MKIEEKNFSLFPDFLAAIGHIERTLKLNRYTITFAHRHLFKETPRHALCVKKAPHTLHAGLFNLPGGSIKPNESPHDAALRELQEETGLAASQPQLIGAITNGPMDAQTPPFLVYIFRAILPFNQTLVFPANQPASWELISHLSTRKFVPNLRFIIPLIACDQMGFIVQDSCWYKETIAASAILTSIPHTITDAVPKRAKKKRRIET